jgi:MFS family permease
MRLLSKTNGRLFYGWIVVTTSFVIFALILGSRYCFGVFLKSIENEFDLTRMATSSIFSIYMMLCPIFAMIGGRVLDRYGPRLIVFSMGVFTGLSLLLTGQANSSSQLFLTYSVLLAIGTGPGYSVLMSTTSRWFDKKRGLALAITASGGGLGTIVLAPFAAHLIGSFDWRTAYAVLGLIVGLGIAPLSMLLKKDPAEIGMLPDGAKVPPDNTAVVNSKDSPYAGSVTLAQALRTRNFWFLGIVWLSFSLCLHLVYTHIVPYVTDTGVSAAEAAVVLGLIGSISIPGRLVMGVVSDKTGRKVSAMICGLLQIGAMVWVAWARELWMVYLFAIVYGFASGGFTIPVTALIGDIFGVHSLGEIMGVLAIGWGLGAAIGPAVGGLIFDVTENYFMAFMIGALAMMVATSFVAIIKHQISTT